MIGCRYRAVMRAVARAPQFIVDVKNNVWITRHGLPLVLEHQQKAAVTRDVESRAPPANQRKTCGTAVSRGRWPHPGPDRMAASKMPSSDAPRDSPRRLRK